MSTPVIYDYDPRNIPAEYLQAIGLVAQCAAHAEGAIKIAIQGLTSLRPDYASALLTHMNAPMLDHALRAVAEIYIESVEALDELDALLDEIKEATVTRNQYVHCSLCRDPEGAVFLERITARGSVDAELIPKSIATIMRDAERIYASSIALIGFLIKNNLMPATPVPVPPRAHKTRAARKKAKRGNSSHSADEA